jgi:hypothetical protein
MRLHFAEDRVHMIAALDVEVAEARREASNGVAVAAVALGISTAVAD